MRALDVKIEVYRPEHRGAFRELNEQWIRQYFRIEPADRAALDDPEGYVLRPGGAIFVAILDTRVVGVCALLKREDSVYPYELAKMAVDPAVRGKNIGWLLGQAVIEQARAFGAERLYLESNSALKPAIGLYEKLGFRKVEDLATPYARCDIQMELPLR